MERRSRENFVAISPEIPINLQRKVQVSKNIIKNENKEREIENPEQVVQGNVWENSGMKYFKNLH